MIYIKKDIILSAKSNKSERKPCYTVSSAILPKHFLHCAAMPVFDSGFKKALQNTGPSP